MRPGTHFTYSSCFFLYGGKFSRLDLKPKLRGQAHGGKQSQPVLAKALPGSPMVRMRRDSGSASPPTQSDFVGEWIVKQAVDGKVAPQGVLRASVKRTLPDAALV
ncbi:MAG: hypothetical protein Ct9H300mP32_5740 [Verrucomicrobiota bacterium]|nr:MAG: hypothetical protein Ct9H300mP32_5740 [Verrucomicrobiota bacterium]